MILLQLCSSFHNVIPQTVSRRAIHYSVCVVKDYHLSEMSQRDIGSVFKEDLEQLERPGALGNSVTLLRDQLILSQPGECHCLMLWKKHQSLIWACSGSLKTPRYWLSSWKWEEHSQNPASIWHQRASTCHECLLAKLHMAIILWKVDLHICATWEVNIVYIGQQPMTKK